MHYYVSRILASAAVLIFSACSYQEVNDPQVVVPEPVERPPNPALEFDPAVPPSPSSRKLTRQEYVESALALFGPDVLVPPTAEPTLLLEGLRLSQARHLRPARRRVVRRSVVSTGSPGG